jgi:hypothetical protein
MTSRPSEPKPPSPLTYVLISGVGLILAVGLLFAYVFLAPRLISAGFQSQFYYMVLVVAGLVAAGFLVGGMRSYDAHVTYKQFGLAVQAGGAIAVFLLVVGIGLYAIPRPDTFNLTVRPVGPRQERIKTGELTLEYADKTDVEAVGTNGEANFKQIPHRYWGQKLKITPEIDGFEKKPLYVLIDAVAVDLPLAPEILETWFSGKVIPPPNKGQIVTILVEGEDQEATPDEFGRFKMLVHKKEGTRVRVTVYRDRKQIYDDFAVLPGPATLVTHNPN